MTFKQRNENLSAIFSRYQVEHDKYTSSNHIMTDEEWKSYMDSMNAIADEYKNGNMDEFSGGVMMAFINDTEVVQKRLKEVNKVE